ncbi:hypothetical protein [Myroides odoratus]|uniref:hypothetical protein n=1 Tax=Myroides odoratus TaxID=256 RepID=UPI0039B09D4B
MLIIEGGDQINAILTLLLIPISILDGRKNAWIVKKTNSKVNRFLLLNATCALFAIKVQMSLLYFNAGVAKIYAPEWANGTAVYYWFNDEVFGAPLFMKKIFGFLFENAFTVTFINWGVIILEIGLFIAIFCSQKYKYIFLILGLILHFVIIIVHGLPAFFMAMAAGLHLYLSEMDITIRENFKKIINLKNLMK